VDVGGARDRAGRGARAPPTPDRLADQAERDFSAASTEHGMRSAFLSNLADNAVIFRPGPINGMKSWKARAEVRPASGPGLRRISGAHDLGFSFGR
jgi:hypothetical protein